MSSFRRFYRPPTAALCHEAEVAVQGAYKKKIDTSYVDQEGRGPLHLILMMEGDEALPVVEHIVRAGAPGSRVVNGADRHGARPLQYAARMGAVRCLKMMLAHGAGIDLQDNAGDTALMEAAAHRQSQALELLLRAGAGVNVTNHRGENALHKGVAVTRSANLGGCEVCVRALLKYGCKMNQQDNSGQTPMHLAAIKGSGDMLRTLLTAHCHAKAQLNLQDSLGRTALHWACDSYSCGSDCQEVGHEHGSARTRDLDNCGSSCLEVLLEHGSPDTSIFDKQHNSPVLLALKKGNVNHLKALLEVNACRVTKDGRSPVALAALMGSHECTELLLVSGLDPNLSGHFDQTPLICAAFETELDIVELLIKRGANINGLTNTTALLASLSCIDPLSDKDVAIRHQIVAQLLYEGADPNIKFARSWYYSPITKRMTSPLSLAFESGYVSLVRMLLTAGCSVSRTELLSWTRDSDRSKDIYNRDDLLKPIHAFIAQPLKLAFQIRLVVRNQISKCLKDRASVITSSTTSSMKSTTPPLPRSLSECIRSLPIAPRLISYLQLEDLYQEEPELAAKIPQFLIRGVRPGNYHPFQECPHPQDLKKAGSLILQRTLLRHTMVTIDPQSWDLY